MPERRLPVPSTSFPRTRLAQALQAWWAVLLFGVVLPIVVFLLALVIVWVSDIGAYFSGRSFGKRKLAPQISPGKTWAGAYGAMIAGVLAGVIGGWLLDVRGGQMLALALLSAATVAISIVGDLLESLLKRHAQIKDSGSIFPGHGGLLDRLDSVFAALPVFAAGLWLIGLL